MARRRPRLGRLERVVGVPGLVATAYGNVGSSIYYALGLVAGYALGLTPVVFIIAGFIFAMTAITYAEGTTAFPEAGGSSSFARHAFGEGTSFLAAWAQMLTYIVTIAISAFFVPHYLSVFWSPLKSAPWDVIVGAAVVGFLALLNIVGLKEAAKLNIGLAALDFLTQVGLVVVGMILLFSPGILLDQIQWGIAPTWSDFVVAITVAMIAYTGIETVSNMSEEARNPAKTIPASIRSVVLLVVVMYATLPVVALSALPVTGNEVDGFSTELGTTYTDDPILGVVDNLGIEGIVLTIAQVYVGLLAATILLIATNAAIIGVSRLTYSMGQHQQLPQRFQALHPKFKTPVVAILVFCAVAVLVMTPAQTNFLGNLYAFGAMLSFSIAHLSIIAMRWKRGSTTLGYRGRPTIRVAGHEVPIFAVLGALGTGAAFVVVLFLHSAERWVGVSWLVIGGIVYYVYRRRQGLPLNRTVRREESGPSVDLELNYTNILVPVVTGPASEEVVAAAGRLAADKGAGITLVTVVEVPTHLPLGADMFEREEACEGLLDHLRRIAAEYEVQVVTHVVRARNAGQIICEMARETGAELIMMSSVADAPGLSRHLFGPVTDYVVRQAPCRVIVYADQPRSGVARRGPGGGLVKSTGRFARLDAEGKPLPATGVRRTAIDAEPNGTEAPPGNGVVADAVPDQEKPVTE